MKKIFILFFILVGCKSSEKIAQKALTDQTAFYKVGNIFRRLNPCVNDTTIISSKDTIEVTHSDTITNVIKENNIIDTVYLRITKYKQLNIHDTIKLSIKDLTSERILNDTLNFYKQLYLQEHGLTMDAIKEKKRWQINFWLLLIATISISFLGIYLKFKTKLL